MAAARDNGIHHLQVPIMHHRTESPTLNPDFAVIKQRQKADQNTAAAASQVAPGEYLEVVVTRR
jgi:hypothetical protein